MKMLLLLFLGCLALAADLPDGASARLGNPSLRHPHAVGPVWSADGAWLATGGMDDHVRIWDASDGRERGSFGMGNDIMALTITPLSG